MPARALEPYERDFVKLLAKGIKIRREQQRDGEIKK